MTLYTSKVVAEWLGVTERRVRQLRDKGIISEVRPGLYSMRPTVYKYITYLRMGSVDFNEERAKLTKEKRVAAEMENKLRKEELLEAEDIEKGLKTMNLNIRSRLLALPAKLAHALAEAGGDQATIYDILKQAVCGVLEELTDYRKLLEERGEGDGTESEDD